MGGGKKSSGAAGERDFFGVGKGWRSGREILEGDLGSGNDGGGGGGTAAGGGGGGEQMWTKYEPFRFSVEFWGVDKLKEKQREYSNTVFYAGSCECSSFFVSRLVETRSRVGSELVR